jgi:hypothetical protein
VKNEGLRRVKKEYCIQNKKEGRVIGLVIILAGNAF